MEHRTWRLSAFGDEIADPLEDQCAVLSRLGVGLVELRNAWGVNVADFDDGWRNRAAETLDRAGIGVSAIGSPLGKVSAFGDAQEEADRLVRSLDAAERLGTDLIRVFSYYVDGRYQDAREHVLRRLDAMAKAAAGRGKTLVLENESHIYGDLPDRCLDVLRSVGSPALRFAFDPANFVQCGVDPMREAWPLLAPYVVHVHIKDAVPIDRSGLEPYPTPAPHDRLMGSVRPAGEGAGGIAALLGELRRRDYRGILTLEPHLAERLPDLDGEGRLATAVAALRRLLDEVEGTGPGA